MTDLRPYQAVAQQIRALVESAEYPPGSRLPGERDLAQRFGVSRVTIREAEIALEAQGWVSIRTGSGVYVLPRHGHGLTELPNISALELTAARSVIEAEVAALAAKHITDDQIRELEDLTRTMSRVDASEDPAEDADQRFHMAIARFSGNPVMEFCVRLLWRMRNEVHGVRRVYGSVCKQDQRSRVSEHEAIVEALRRRNPVAARAAMRDHFHRLFEAMLSVTETEALSELQRRSERDRQRFLATLRL